jgi:signal transduction histidine kinase
MVSHELRNPLSAILQSADNIIATLDDPVARRKTSVEMIDGVLDSAQTIILCAQHQKVWTMRYSSLNLSDTD